MATISVSPCAMQLRVWIRHTRPNPMMPIPTRSLAPSKRPAENALRPAAAAVVFTKVRRLIASELVGRSRSKEGDLIGLVVLKPCDAPETFVQGGKARFGSACDHDGQSPPERHYESCPGPRRCPQMRT